MKSMGGVKKKSMASMEKSQDSSETAQGQSEPAKGKKTKEKSAPQQKRQLAFLPPKMSDADLLKTLTPLKAITVYTASRALGVNASIASSVLRQLEEKSMLRRAGGFSGHGVWAVKS
jgi:small subunit ribosomal protein S25e